MIIGISGKKQSGKDTVAKIVQWLVYSSYKPQKHHTQEEWLKIGDVWGLSGWDRKQFADKLKNIVCLLIGCTREQLEDNDFKEKELGEEWWCYEYVCTSLGNKGEEVRMAGTLIPYPDNRAEELMKNNSKKLKYVKLIKLTPRKLLQLIGTECGREIIHPNIWISALMSEYKLDTPKRQSTILPNWIITDVRFPNELKAIEDRGGVVIRVNRNPRPYNNIEGKEINKTYTDTHESETALDNHEFSFTIGNDGTIEDLISKVRFILETIKIL